MCCEDKAQSNEKIGGTETGKLERNSSFELLRILAMLLIISHHIFFHGGGNNIDFSEGINRYIGQCFNFAGWLGVDIFFILSGYFMVSGKFRLKKFLKLNFAATFYSVLALLLVIFVWHGKQDINAVFKAVFPVYLNNYWFIAIYAVIYVLSPFFNKLINQLDKKHFTAMTVIMFIWVCVIPAVSFRMKITLLWNLFLTGIYCYFIGAYLRKYPIKFMDNIPVSALIFAVTYAAMSVISIFAAKYPDTAAIKDLSSMTENHNSLLMILCAVSLVMLFKNIKIGTVKFINFITQGILGVYLIHDSPQFRGYIWNNVFHTPDMWKGSLCGLNLAKTALLVFICATVIELARIYLIEKPLFNLKIFDKPCKKIDDFMNGM